MRLFSTSVFTFPRSASCRTGLVLGWLALGPLLGWAQGGPGQPGPTPGQPGGSGAVGIGTTTPDPSAALDVQSATGGLLVPRLTRTQRRAIISPKPGLVVYQLGSPAAADSAGLWVHGPQGWQYLDATRPLPTLSKTGNQISLSSGGSGSVTDADNQTLTASSSGGSTTISISGVSGAGASVTVPSSADNLGNHTATQALRLSGNWLSNDGGAEGLRVDDNGNVGLGGTRTLELGAGVSGKEANAGKIGYQTFTANALDVVGAGTTNTDRRVKVWAEGGTEINGPVRVGGLAGNGTRPVVATAQGDLAPATGLLSRLATGQAGTAVLGPCAGASCGTGLAVYYVPFPTGYTVAPGQVLVTVRTEPGQGYNDTFAVTVKQVTDLGFTVNIRRVDSAGSWSQSLRLDWLAIP